MSIAGMTAARHPGDGDRAVAALNAGERGRRRAPDDDDELSPEQWNEAWSAELAQRVREIRTGTVELIDGDEMLSKLDAIAHRR
jgi:hypothetical protein